MYIGHVLDHVDTVLSTLLHTIHATIYLSFNNCIKSCYFPIAFPGEIIVKFVLCLSDFPVCILSGHTHLHLFF